MRNSNWPDVGTIDGLGEPLVAYVYGDAPTDFAAIAAAGFEVVCLDSRAPWFDETVITRAKAHGLMAVGFPMAYGPLTPTTFRAKMRR